MSHVFNREIHWIGKLRLEQGDLVNKSSSHYLLNVADGGGGSLGYTWTVEDRLKASVAMKGRSKSPEAVAKLKRTLDQQGGTWKNREFSENHKKRLSDASKGENNPFYGKNHGEAAKAKISLANGGENSSWLGRKHTKETIDKIRAGQINKVVVRGDKVGTAMLTETDVLEIRRRANSGEAKASICRDFAVGYTQITRIINREAWEHVQEQKE